jgi:hypothetical protein
MSRIVKLVGRSRSDGFIVALGCKGCAKKLNVKIEDY